MLVIHRSNHTQYSVVSVTEHLIWETMNKKLISLYKSIVVFYLSVHLCK